MFVEEMFIDFLPDIMNAPVVTIEEKNGGAVVLAGEVSMSYQ
jgi:hypothetical protein